MKSRRSAYAAENRDITLPQSRERKAIGYIRVSTDARAMDGLSLDAQTAAIEQDCALHGIRLIRICRDVSSGAKTERSGLQEALATLQRGADILVVLKFDRLSRSIRHFCELYGFLYQWGKRHGWYEPQPHNERSRTDEELKARIIELRERGHTFLQIASLLNEPKWIPLKGRKFTGPSVGKLLRGLERDGIPLSETIFGRNSETHETGTSKVATR